MTVFAVSLNPFHYIFEAIGFVLTVALIVLIWVVSIGAVVAVAWFFAGIFVVLESVVFAVSQLFERHNLGHFDRSLWNLLIHHWPVFLILIAYNVLGIAKIAIDGVFGHSDGDAGNSGSGSPQGPVGPPDPGSFNDPLSPPGHHF